MPAVTRSRMLARTIMITYIAFGMRVFGVSVYIMIGHRTLRSRPNASSNAHADDGLETPARDDQDLLEHEHIQSHLAAIEH